MRMRVDAAGHDVTARCINGFIAGQIIAHGNNLLAFDENVGFKGAVGRNHGAAFDDLTCPRTNHVRRSPFWFCCEHSAVLDGGNANSQFQQSPIRHEAAHQHQPMPILWKYLRLRCGLGHPRMGT
ncbi:hypothetical protein D9M72_521870 [compost metagenome]